jgi:hypothetical protein
MRKIPFEPLRLGDCHKLACKFSALVVPLLQEIGHWQAAKLDVNHPSGALKDAKQTRERFTRISAESQCTYLRGSPADG